MLPRRRKLHVSMCHILPKFRSFVDTVSAMSHAENADQHLPPIPTSSAAAASEALSIAISPLDLREQLPFFVYGTLCSGFRNWEALIKVTP